ncbi:hypothetical protein PHLGIDRAFT_76231 [Phlebiopsis gigantea 11061_1 CR5-6]|uniref:Stealth protein CR3 conserved region 3 domain-containing protein n=1 Tax=Phlebiopsis gigantea (strain 11061_1 CR5-6) TaxID=745531 RepID=A0A0C3PFB6_PHLG1|nr:hypothetical protein PHLGIDRAFT_76231 [Phlebiopsis gigantea 11061_1 CR5-6]
MRYGDYIPLATTPTAARSTFDQESRFDSAKPGRARWRRPLVLGTGLVIILAALYLITADLLDDAENLFLDDSDYFPDYHAAYLPFEPPNPDANAPPASLSSTQALPDHCRDAYFSIGAVCYDPEQPRMDVVWTWVNGSDPLLQAAKLEAESRFSDDDPYRPKTSAAAARQYRDNDELRHSMRSVLSNYRYHTGRFHLITSDFAIPENTQNLSIPDDWRLGQVPQWLDMTNRDWTDGDIELNVLHHAEIFQPYTSSSFNSYAIESQFAHLPNVSAHFTFREMQLPRGSKAHNSQRTMIFTWRIRSHRERYGIVLRMDLSIMVSPDKPRADEPHGEWRSMGESNVLLSNRFGARHRPYVLHEAKAASMSLIRELSAMWASHMARAATHPFRETVSGVGDVSMLFLMVHFVVERWREALLWSWTVAKHGGLDDEWNDEIMRLAWLELGGGRQSSVTVRAGFRETLEDDRVRAYLKEGGHRQADKTYYVSAALDGYPYAYITEEVHSDWQWFKPSTVKEEDLPECTLVYDECFTDGGASFTHASEVFKHIAFRQPQCGDCVIQALMRASGRLGMEAFLPSPHRVVPAAPDAPASARDEVPHLSMEERWQDGQFAVSAVLQTSARAVNVRDWTLRLLERYRFVIGYSPYAFVMLETLQNAHDALGWISSYTDVSLVCINDDVREDHEEVTAYFKDWQDRKWGRHAAWER